MTDLDGQTRWDGWPDTPAPRDPWKDGYAAAKRHYGTGAQSALAEVERGLRGVLTLKPPPSARRQLEAILDTVTDARKEAL